MGGAVLLCALWKHYPDDSAPSNRAPTVDGPFALVLATQPMQVPQAPTPADFELSARDLEKRAMRTQDTEPSGKT
ncbi:MAG: hypothetical protein DMG77_17640 [Acidobacteria bacterium]|nr:MAG: hypothetical protein DMG77_17640 [Acidobacteriota bacterium]